MININVTQANMTTDNVTPGNVTPDNVTQVNVTLDDDEEHNDAVTPVILFVLYFLMSALIIFGNVLTLVVLCKFKSLYRITNAFIASLSIADMILGISLPQCAFVNHTRLIRGLNENKYACLSCRYFNTLSASVSLFSITAIAVERYMAIMKPYFYTQYATRCRINTFAVAIWFYGLALQTIAFFGLQQWNPNTYCSVITVLPNWAFNYIMLPHIIICIILSIGLYTCIFCTASRHRRRISVQHSVAGLTPVNQDTKLAQMMCLILGLFLLCWTPYWVLSVAIATMKHNSPYELQVAYQFSVCFLYANSFMNPLVYGWKNTEFKRAYKQTLCCCRGDKSITIDSHDMYDIGPPCRHNVN
ncbi:unnamed protein product [Owenia fusiformis]|uniref:Uncharacterized protein n=1 Tax=Owenia fusiformis TaxID=6347 RepID=A0A8J1XKV9_OWEFU|nr:unnamed protein product [Owenia fusiformis]